MPVLLSKLLCALLLKCWCWYLHKMCDVSEMFIESVFVHLRHFLRPKCDADRPRPGLMTRRNTGRSRGSCGRPPWCESWAGRDGANQEYLNDEIFSQPLFSPGQLSRAVAGWLVSAAPRPMSSVLYYRCCLRMWPDVATGEQTITTTSRILSHCCQLEVGSCRKFWSFWSLIKGLGIGRCSFETECSV